MKFACIEFAIGVNDGLMYVLFFILMKRLIEAMVAKLITARDLDIVLTKKAGETLKLNQTSYY